MLIEKLLVAQVAATLTAGVVVNLPDNLPLDPNLGAPELKGANLQAWETFRVFYHAIVKALPNDDPATGWPAPKLEAGGLVSSVLGALAPALAGQGPLGTTLAPLLAKLLGGGQGPAAPALPPGLPNPGEPVVRP